MRLASFPLVVLLLTPGLVYAAPINVTSSEELLVAIQKAKAGDEILLADGNYPINQSKISCSANGTEAAPIVVRAVNPLGAQLLLNTLEGFFVTGKYWRFEGLVLQGTCPDDSDCEHAFHVVGDADNFAMIGCTVRNFNAQLKVNATKEPDGVWNTPDRGLIEGCDLGDDKPRKTSNPVTKLNIDTGDDWVVRGNFIHDFYKDGGNGISYGAFMKSGGKRGIFERNLVVCSYNVPSGGTRIGLSFGGGGTGAQFCAPAFDPNVPCNVEHEDGILRNNIIASCSDVGIYLNRAKNTRVLHNTLVATSGIDFRFDTTSGEADGNLLAGKIRNRDGATHQAKTNLAEVSEASFLAWYSDPASGDLSLKGDISSLVAKVPPRPDVLNDYCLRSRPSSPTTLGALEHTLGDCQTFPLPDGTAGSGGSQAGEAGGTTGQGGTGATGGADGTGGSSGGGQAGSAGIGGSGVASTGGTANTGEGGTSGTGGVAGTGAAGTNPTAGTGGASAGFGGAAAGTGGAPAAPAAEEEGGCGCRVGGRARETPGAGWFLLTLGWPWRRKPREGCHRGNGALSRAP
ncbi:MAG: chondroitinase-B domain-containing protein [Myxococcales bacterium]|nr:right-handed parallel beta-helix repeat-containing protein [Polyangiaceae bacterium]MDW8251670.1 chondroitinase-B domain-containing protein [Myxococcales bacterium]